MSSEEYPKSESDYFADWERHVFGFGYGTGEDHVVGALVRFFALLDEGRYSHNTITTMMGGDVAWLLINALCKARILDYGTSARFGWLTPQGERLRDYLAGKTAEVLAESLERGSDYIYCMPDACNCGPKGYDKSRVCRNPFWQQAAGIGSRVH